jgi:hypothetical protein
MRPIPSVALSTNPKETAMPTAAQMAKIRRLARAELAHPVGAYDQITHDGRHPLAHLVDEPTPPFFANLAHRVANEIINPSGRYPINAAERRQLARQLLGKEQPVPRYRHPLLTRDQLFEQTGQGPEYNQCNQRNGDQNRAMPSGGSRQPMNGDQEQAPIDADDCVQFLTLLLAKLPPDQHDELIARLAEIIQGAHGNGGETAAVGDRSFRSSRRPAQDSAIQALKSRSFQRRFPFVNVSLNGAGR